MLSLLDFLLVGSFGVFVICFDFCLLFCFGLLYCYCFGVLCLLFGMISVVFCVFAMADIC